MENCRNLNDLVGRIRRIEGQSRGIQRMLENERELEAVLIQLAAMRSAIDRLGHLLIESDLLAEFLTFLPPGDDASRADALKALEIFLRF